MFIEAKDDGGGGDNWTLSLSLSLSLSLYWKAPVKSSPPTNQHPVFTGQMPFVSANQQCPSTEWKILEDDITS